MQILITVDPYADPDQARCGSASIVLPAFQLSDTDRLISNNVTYPPEPGYTYMYIYIDIDI